MFSRDKKYNKQAETQQTKQTQQIKVNLTFEVKNAMEMENNQVFVIFSRKGYTSLTKKTLANLHPLSLLKCNYVFNYV